MGDLPAVTVSDPRPGGGDQTTVVSGGDDLVADPDGVVGDGNTFGFDLPGGDAFGSGSHGELVDAVMIRGHHNHRPALVAGFLPRLMRSFDGLLAVTGADPVTLGVLVDDTDIASS